MRQEHQEIDLIRHSFAHILAFAVLRLYKDTKLGIGPAVDNGFYHDFKFEKPIKQEDLAKIEAEMRKIIEEDLPFQQIWVNKEEAYDLLNLQGQIFKTEIVSSIPEDVVSFYRTGNEFMDLCRGPHVEHTGKLSAFKLTGISGVHWNNDENRPELQRIHGVAFATETELSNYFEAQEQKKERDHRKVAQRLGLYTISSENGAGLPLWLPRGAAIRKKILEYLYKENMKNGYEYVSTPVLARTEIFTKSGELESRGEQFYPPISVENEQYSFKPRSFPFHIQIFDATKHSYRDLPFKLSEFSQVLHNEKSGELSGLYKVRSFTSDTNLIISSKVQLKEQIIQAIKLNMQVYKDFGLENYRIELALRGHNESIYEGDPKDWVKMEALLADSCKSINSIVYEAPNTAEKCGPGINFKFEDVYGKSWKVGSIYFDIKAPSNYRLRFINSKNKYETPYTIVRSAIGSLERFFAILTENLNGSFPLWLSPMQVCVIPISEKFIDYAREVNRTLIENDLHTIIDEASETMQNKIREAQLKMVPYMVIVGEKEQTNNTISLRPRSGQELGMMKISEFIERIRNEIDNKVVF